jgi:hypothetical protein
MSIEYIGLALRPASFASLATLLLLAGCQTATLPVLEPALLLEPTPQTSAELLTAIGGLLGRTPTAVDTSALHSNSRLNFAASAGPGAATGRVLDAPVQIQLMTDGRNCLLVRGTERRPLRLTRCRPE